MDTSSAFDSQNNILSSLLHIIREIAEKSSDSDYIYRGEPDCYDTVSSTLYRVFGKFNVNNFNKEVVPNMLKEVKEYIDETDDFEILTQLQHFGGDTNLIDFTTDLFIALFFACDGFHNKDGRVILKDRNGDIKDCIIERPRNPQNRVIAQKSIFVCPPQGFVEPDYEVSIRKDLKRSMLDHLQKFHGISAATIYNDIHGFIRRSAYTQFCNAVKYQNDKQHENAIKHYTEAIVLNPEFAEAYVNRSISYCKMNEFDLAIKDCRKAIERKPNLINAHYDLGNAYTGKKKYHQAINAYKMAIELNPKFAEAYSNCGICYRRIGKYNQAIEVYNAAIKSKPDYAEAYCNRGVAWLHMEAWEKARVDLTTAKNKGVDIIDAFRKTFGSVEDFKQKTGIQLPEDIATMLTPS